MARIAEALRLEALREVRGAVGTKVHGAVETFEAWREVCGAVETIDPIPPIPPIS